MKTLELILKCKRALSEQGLTAREALEILLAELEVIGREEDRAAALEGADEGQKRPLAEISADDLPF